MRRHWRARRSMPDTLAPPPPLTGCFRRPQVSLISAPRWHGLDGYPASAEILPGSARLLSLLVTFVFTTIRLPPLWAAHASHSGCDTLSTSKQRPLKGARSLGKRQEAAGDFVSPKGMPLSALWEEEDSHQA